MKLRLLLINPPYPYEESPTPPFGLMSLAAYLLEQGIDVKIEDYIVTVYSEERLAEILDEYDPQIAGSTGVTMNIKTSLKILKKCKEIRPEIKTIMGGPHVTFDAEAILRENPYVDFIVRGEGEITTSELIYAIKDGKSPQDLFNIDGISYRTNNRIIHNKDRDLIKDINILPMPARHLIQLSKYKALGFPLNMVTSRGCPYKCIFCVGRKMVGSRVRYFDVKRVVDEFEMLSKMRFRQINIVDDLFTANEKRCIAICDEIIKREIKHKWNAFSRVDTISKNLLIKLLEAGCDSLCFGIESGDQGILDTAKKKTTLQKIQRAIDLCNETGMQPMASYIMGLPGETPETIEKSLKFAKELCSNYGFHILAPFPGTEVRENAEKFGIKILTNDWDMYDANRAITDNGTITPKEINAIAEKFNKLFRNYVDDLLDREKKEPLSEKDRSFMDNLHSLAFSLNLIQKECVEKYNGLSDTNSDKEIIQDFLKYINNSTNTEGKLSATLLDRLFELNCLRITENNNKKTLAWR